VGRKGFPITFNARGRQGRRPVRHRNRLHSPGAPHELVRLWRGDGSLALDVSAHALAATSSLYERMRSCLQRGWASAALAIIVSEMLWLSPRHRFTRRAGTGKTRCALAATVSHLCSGQLQVRFELTAHLTILNTPRSFPLPIETAVIVPVSAHSKCVHGDAGETRS